MCMPIQVGRTRGLTGSRLTSRAMDNQREWSRNVMDMPPSGSHHGYSQQHARRVDMAHRFDATLKDLGREAPAAFLTAFDATPAAPVSLLNVDLSAVSRAADLIVGLGDPLQEIVQMDFQASASATKHAD